MDLLFLRLFNVYGGNNFLVKNNGVISKWIKCILINLCFWITKLAVLEILFT